MKTLHKFQSNLHFIFQFHSIQMLNTTAAIAVAVGCTAASQTVDNIVCKKCFVNFF